MRVEIVIGKASANDGVRLNKQLVKWLAQAGVVCLVLAMTLAAGVEVSFDRLREVELAYSSAEMVR